MRMKASKAATANVQSGAEALQLACTAALRRLATSGNSEAKAICNRPHQQRRV